jgi:CheY-like chemotaxis protein
MRAIRIALRMVRNRLKFDLLVTDFAMPGINAQLAAELRKHDPTLPVLMIMSKLARAQPQRGQGNTRQC